MYPLQNQVNRIIDANLNRLKEGLRVCEEITRFALDNRKLTSEFKAIRHRIESLTRQIASGSALLKVRNAKGDIGRNIRINELRRIDIKDIFFANMQRIKESLRVLEEFSKLISKKTALGFKDIRYRIYELEKKCGLRIALRQ